MRLENFFFCKKPIIWKNNNLEYYQLLLFAIIDILNNSEHRCFVKKAILNVTTSGRSIFFFFKKQSVNILSVSSEESSLDIDHAEEMELLLENYYMQVSSSTFLL